MIDYNVLEQCPVFKGIAEPDLRMLFKDIHYQIRNFKRSDLIAMAGEPAVNLYIILSGSVRGEMIDYSGKTLKIEDIEAPLPLATAFLFGNNNRFPVTVTANSGVKMLAVPVREFIKLLQQDSRVLINFLNSISSRSQFLSRKLQFLSFKTIRGKVAHFLLQQVNAGMHTVKLNMTQQQLAELFGVTRPSLARVMAEMQREKLIITDHKNVTLLNRQKLNQILRNE